MRTFLTVLILAVLTGPFQGFCAPLTSGADFLLVTTGARAEAMGQAFSAVADDINTLSFNPAGLANIRLPEVGYAREEFVSDIHFDFLGAAIPFGGAGVLGLGYLGMGVTPFNSTANSSAPLVTAQDTALILGWGKSFYNLHLGAAVKYISQQVDTQQETSWGFDLGLRYRVLPHLTFAVSALNLEPGPHLMDSESLPALLKAGGAWGVLEEPVHTLTLAGDVSYDATSEIPYYSLGAEYWYLGQFALRAGYLFNSQDQGISAGAGIRLGLFQLDYAFQPFNLLGSVNHFSGILRWDGPWVAGGEPNAPKYVSVEQKPEGLEIRWEKPQGPVQGYEVLIQPLDGGELRVSPRVSGPPFIDKTILPATLYKISVRTIGEGNGKSFPSREVYFMTRPLEEAPAPSVTAVKTAVLPRVSAVVGAVRGRLDAVGLRLSWDAVSGAAGYNLYRKDSLGRVEKVNSKRKEGHEVWVMDPWSFRGWEWIVSSVGQAGSGEKVLGSFVWSPTAQEEQGWVSKPGLKLHASPETGHKVFLDWDRIPAAVQYALFYSTDSDKVLEFYKNLDSKEVTAFLQIFEERDHVYVLIAPVSAEGFWLSRSNIARAELNF